MWQPLKVLVVFSLFFIFFAGSAFALDNAVLKLHVHGMNGKIGTIVIGIFSRPDRFEKNMTPMYSIKEPLKPDGAYEISIPEGTYALKIYQDKNGNGTFDSNEFLLTKGPKGFSKDLYGVSPHFDDALIKVKKDKENSVDINLK